MAEETGPGGWTIRPATAADLITLAAMRPPESLHRDRLADAAAGHLAFLLAERSGKPVGFGLLVFSRPPSWGDQEGDALMPGICDLWVRPESRSAGAGSALIARMVQLARERGHGRIYTGVDPVENPRAAALYKRLGFRPLQPEPKRLTWRFTDSAGRIHQGDEWNVDLVLELSGPADAE